MIKVREIKSMNDIDAIEYENDCVDIIRENGWIRTDMTTQCKSYKTALNRYFAAIKNILPDMYGWKEGIEESCENGYCSDNNRTMADGGKNECISYAWEIEAVDDDLYYFFFNCKDALSSKK